jgi:hypothetical protein
MLEVFFIMTAVSCITTSTQYGYLQGGGTAASQKAKLNCWA